MNTFLVICVLLTPVFLALALGLLAGSFVESARLSAIPFFIPAALGTMVGVSIGFSPPGICLYWLSIVLTYMASMEIGGIAALRWREGQSLGLFAGLTSVGVAMMPLYILIANPVLDFPAP